MWPSYGCCFPTMVWSSDVFRLVIQDAFLEADKEGNGAISLEELRIVSSSSLTS